MATPQNCCCELLEASGNILKVVNNWLEVNWAGIANLKGIAIAHLNDPSITVKKS
ncbi:MAG: hypothetical protein HC866_22035 [Leptolyngbyaceae cyanobacterium RU_5_1]|nr:hypothetical protein [Leptolyngbyaceae cyanobacterium RU_5_1]